MPLSMIHPLGELHDHLSYRQPRETDQHVGHTMHLSCTSCDIEPVVSVAGIDYEATSVQLEFPRGSTRECHTVTIIPDEVCELTSEDFFADLALVTGTPIININSSVTQIIIDDADETDCSESNPTINFKLII